ncbi:MAG: response regulator [Flexistipes sinusarabici]|uniref:histidine kinase n=1 Tax=Flexistipes sinusarabici TaxID=2352 RepID=A0A5D0MI95_FLESI|nr:ATP-binding protein [Flexistipes sinusarabici]TYB32696.1 MAG: response regulator [Flexistipes sinusarabici]
MYRILYAEDNFENYKLVEFVLKKNGFDAKSAVDGLDVIDKVENYKPHLIIMDIDLPNLMRYEVTSWLKSKEEYKNIPVVALTGDYAGNYEVVSKMSGCVAYYSKPVDPVSFVSEVKKFIETYQENPDTQSLSEQMSKSLENKARQGHNLNKQLKGYENKFSGILSKLSDIIIITDREFNITYYNSSAIEKEVFRKCYISGMNFFELFRCVDMNVEELRKKLEKNGKLSNIDIELESVGGTGSFFLGNFDVTDDEVVISLREVSSDVKNFNTLDQVDKMAGLGVITSGIIHEINNPLTAIKTYLEVLKMKISDNTLKNVVEKIDTGFQTIEKLTNSLLGFAKPSREKPYPININNIVKEVMSFSEYEIRRGNVKVNFDMQDDIPVFNGIKSQIEQAVLNLLINANHAVSKNESPEIIIKTYAEGSYIVFEVADNGPGIREDIQKRIFDPFFTTKSKDKATGLGLTMVKQIVERHNGILDFTSDNKGTNFIIKFARD